MSLYKLIKPLPKFEVGDEFHTSRSGHLVHTKTGVLAYAKHELREFPNILKDWFKEIPERPKTVDSLKDGDLYHAIASDGFITTEICRSHNRHETDMRIAIGNAFLTKEEAEKELNRRKAKVILEHDTKGFKPDWSNDYDKYEVYYDYEYEELYVNYYTVYSSHRSLWFASKEDAEASIKTHEKEWKTYLGVEE